MNRPLPLKGKVYECFPLYRRFVNRPYKHLKLPAKPKFEILANTKPDGSFSVGSFNV